MVELSPKRPWFIVDTRLRESSDSTLLPGNFRYVLRKDRLAVYAHGMGLNRRWEFQLGEGETAPSEDQALGWISEYIDRSSTRIRRCWQIAGERVECSWPAMRRI
jgi:hypothetical protein